MSQGPADSGTAPGRETRDPEREVAQAKAILAIRGARLSDDETDLLLTRARSTTLEDLEEYQTAILASVTRGQYSDGDLARMQSAAACLEFLREPPPSTFDETYFHRVQQAFPPLFRLSPDEQRYVNDPRKFARLAGQLSATEDLLHGFTLRQWTDCVAERLLGDIRREFVGIASAEVVVTHLAITAGHGPIDWEKIHATYGDYPHWFTRADDSVVLRYGLTDNAGPETTYNARWTLRELWDMHLGRELLLDSARAGPDTRRTRKELKKLDRRIKRTLSRMSGYTRSTLDHAPQR